MLKGRGCNLKPVFYYTRPRLGMLVCYIYLGNLQIFHLSDIVTIYYYGVLCIFKMPANSGKNITESYGVPVQQNRFKETSCYVVVLMHVYTNLIEDLSRSV